MSSRNLLIVILLTVVLIPPFCSFASQILWRSANQLQAEIDETVAALEEASNTLEDARMARNQLKPLLEGCFPEPESTAAAFFQKWIYENATAAGLRDTVAAAGRTEARQ